MISCKSSLRVAQVTFFCAALTALFPQSGLSLDSASTTPAIMTENLERFEKDTELACENKNISEAREANANYAIKHIENQLSQIRVEIKSRQEGMNTLETTLPRKIHDQLIEAKDILDHERAQVGISRGSMKASQLANLKVAEKQVGQLQAIEDGFKKRKQGLTDPVSQQYLNNEIDKVREQIKAYSKLSDQHETLLKTALGCWATAGSIGSPGRELTDPLTGAAVPSSSGQTTIAAPAQATGVSGGGSNKTGGGK